MGRPELGGDGAAGKEATLQSDLIERGADVGDHVGDAATGTTHLAEVFFGEAPDSVDLSDPHLIDDEADLLTESVLIAELADQLVGA